MASFQDQLCDFLENGGAKGFLCVRVREVSWKNKAFRAQFGQMGSLLKGEK